jgi:hypothetical protein
MPEMTSDKHWHLDRKVPIFLIFAILVQTAVLASFIGSLDNRVSHLETAQVLRGDERDRLVVLEVQMRAIHDTLIRIERQLERNDRAAREHRDAPKN